MWDVINSPAITIARLTNMARLVNIHNPTLKESDNKAPGGTILYPIGLITKTQ